MSKEDEKTLKRKVKEKYDKALKAVKRVAKKAGVKKPSRKHKDDDYKEPKQKDFEKLDGGNTRKKPIRYG